MLSALELVVNNTWQTSIENTPFFLNFCRHPRFPADVVLPSENPAADQFVTSRRKLSQEHSHASKLRSDEARPMLTILVVRWSLQLLPAS